MQPKYEIGQIINFRDDKGFHDSHWKILKSFTEEELRLWIQQANNTVIDEEEYRDHYEIFLEHLEGQGIIELTHPVDWYFEFEWENDELKFERV